MTTPPKSNMITLNFVLMIARLFLIAPNCAERFPAISSAPVLSALGAIIREFVKEASYHPKIKTDAKSSGHDGTSATHTLIYEKPPLAFN